VVGLEGPVRAAYEVGPTGFALARRLQTAGVHCLVCAPELVPRGPSDRVARSSRSPPRASSPVSAGARHPRPTSADSTRWLGGSGRRGPSRRASDKTTARSGGSSASSKA